MLSLRKFAEKTGFSRMAISRAFSPEGKISENKREIILQLAAKYNFRPCVVRPSVRAGKTKSLGVLYSRHNASYFDDIRNGIQDFLLEKSYLPMMLAVDADNIGSCLNRLVDHRIDGLILPYIRNDIVPGGLSFFQEQNIPLVAFAAPPGCRCDIVHSDNNMGGRLAARHLLGLGHRRIALFMSNTNTESETNIESFAAECEEHGVSIPPSAFINHSPDTIHATLQSRQFTAAFAANDMLALDVMRIARSLDIHIPGQLSLVGFADLNFTSRLSPPLTTVRQNGYAEGAEAARLAVKRIEGDSSPFANISIPTTFVKRESTAAPVAKK